jgi:glutathione S-transferase
MLALYHSPMARSARIYWLLEELGIPYELKRVEFVPPERPFAQSTPTGKLPTLEDGDVVLFESGAIVEYVLERYGDGRLAPPPGSPLRARYLQWVHFAESTAFAPLGNIAWHMMQRKDADQIPTAMADYRGWATAALDVLERALADGPYLLGDELSGADIMAGYTVQVAHWFGLVEPGHPRVAAYLQRLSARPAFARTITS